MSETIGNSNPFSSGGHAWVWPPLAPAAKLFGATGVDGDGRTVLRMASIEGHVAGLLRVDGAADKAAADAALSVLEAVILAMVRSGAEQAWEDDRGRTGSHLVVERYEPHGPRAYGDGGKSCWQAYVVAVRELSGGI